MHRIPEYIDCSARCHGASRPGRRFLPPVGVVVLMILGPAVAQIAVADEPEPSPTSTQPDCIEVELDEAPPTLQLEPGTSLLAVIQESFVILVDRVAPAVVAIQADRSPGAVADEESPTAWSHSGSGVVIRADGMILTSQHVIEDALALHITLPDGRRARARVVGADSRSDLAVIQVIGDRFTTAELGDARRLRRGDMVLAMGNPLGLAADGQAAVSWGLVSAIGRPLPGRFDREEDRYYGDMIQTSAPITPGHSGGPLVDIHGRVVGVLTAMSVPAAGGEAIAFAVPIGDRTRGIIERLLRGERIDYGYLGVEGGTLTALQAREAELPEGCGALVDSIDAGGPAHRAGLMRGDVILSVSGEAVNSADGFIQRVGALEPGREVEIEMLRGTKRRTVRAEVGLRPAPGPLEDDGATVSFRGAVIGRVGSEMRRASNLPADALLVMMVSGQSPADRAGLTPGDIIVRIDGLPVTSDAIDRLTRVTDDCLLGLANGGSVLIEAR